MDAKRFLTLALLTAFLGGCVIVPWGHGYRDHRDGYWRGGGDGYYHGYDQRGYGYQGRGR